MFNLIKYIKRTNLIIYLYINDLLHKSAVDAMLNNWKKENKSKNLFLLIKFKFESHIL